MLFQEVNDFSRFVRREVVENDVNLLLGRTTVHHLAQEGDELVARVAGSGLAQDIAGLGVEGGIQRKGAVSPVFESVAFGTPWSEGEGVCRCGLRLEWRSSHPRRRPQRAAAGSDTGR